MKKVISIVLILMILASMNLVSAGGYILTKVNFGGNEYYLHPQDCINEEKQGKNLPVDLSIMFREDLPDDGRLPNGELLETLFFPAKINDIYKDGSDVFVRGVWLSFGEKANTKNVIIENGIKKLSMSLDSCTNLKCIVIPETVSQISLDSTGCYTSSFCSTEYAKWRGVTHGQMTNDGGRDTIIYVYDELEKALGLQQGQLTEKVYEPEYDSYGTWIKPEYEDAVDKYAEQYEISTYAKSRQDLVFYVKSGSYAEGYLRSSGFNVKPYVSVTYNGNEVYSDQPAVIVGGRTFVPLRAALESMGATVDWNNDTRTVISERGGTKISLAIGSNQLYVNGTAKTIDVPAQLINGRTMVPARAVAEAFGCDVSWDNDTRTAIIKE